STLLRTFPIKEATTIFEDSQSRIAMTKNPVHHTRTKHIDVQYHFIHKQVENNNIELQYCPTDDMVADILTKATPKGRFKASRQKMGLRKCIIEGGCWKNTSHVLQQ